MNFLSIPFSGRSGEVCRKTLSGYISPNNDVCAVQSTGMELDCFSADVIKILKF